MTTSRYLQYLPAPLQEGDIEAGGFLGRFLLAFECLLTGLEERKELEGIEHKLDRIHTWFDPIGEDPVGGGRAPDEFLPWLAGWVAVSLREEWTSEARRRFIRRAVSLHRKRGTLEGMREMLQLFLGNVPLQVTDGGEFPAHFFHVSFSVPDRDPVLLARLAHMVRTLIDQQKPAHTFYGLEIKFPTMRLTRVKGQQLTIGRNTILGTAKFNS